MTVLETVPALTGFGPRGANAGVERLVRQREELH